MEKNIRGKNILRKLFLGLLACLLLPACAGDEEDIQETLPQKGDSNYPGVGLSQKTDYPAEQK